MTVGIMQPYFMPYLGYFALINCVDEFILFDTPQFIRHGWIERNKVLKLDGETFYLKVPLLKHSRDTSIKNVNIDNSTEWETKILSQLTHYKKRAPNYSEVIKLFNCIFSEKYTSIVTLNFRALQLVCNYLDINTPINVWSKKNVEIEAVNSPDEWALNICKGVSATTYINPTGGLSFFDSNKYKASHIELKFLEYLPKPYQQFGHSFVPFLSIVDVMMFCEPKFIKELLTNFNFIEE